MRRAKHRVARIYPRIRFTVLIYGVFNMKTIEEKLQRNFERQRTYQQRAIERQREKQANPEWRQAQYEKHRERQSRYIERAKINRVIAD